MFIHTLLLTVFIISISIPALYIISQRDTNEIRDDSDTSSDDESNFLDESSSMSLAGAMSGTIG